MMSLHREHDKAATQIAKELEDEGYAVILEPSGDVLPFPLAGYTPDIIATKSDDHLIVEIKTREAASSDTKYRKMLDIVEKHPGWRFLIKSVKDAGSQPDHQPRQPVSAAKIEDYLKKVETAVASGAGEIAIPLYWNVIAALLRHKAAKEGVSAEELSDRSLVNKLYTLGVISSSDYENLTRWHELRNAAVHNIEFVPQAGTTEALRAYVRSLINELNLLPPGKSCSEIRG